MQTRLFPAPADRGRTHHVVLERCFSPHWHSCKHNAECFCRHAWLPCLQAQMQTQVTRGRVRCADDFIRQEEKHFGKTSPSKQTLLKNRFTLRKYNAVKPINQENTLGGGDDARKAQLSSVFRTPLHVIRWNAGRLSHFQCTPSTELLLPTGVVRMTGAPGIHLLLHPEPRTKTWRAESAAGHF